MHAEGKPTGGEAAAAPRYPWLVAALVAIPLVTSVALAGRGAAVVAPLSALAGAVLGGVTLHLAGVARVRGWAARADAWSERHRVLSGVLLWGAFFALIGAVPPAVVVAVAWFSGGSVGAYGVAVWRGARRGAQT